MIELIDIEALPRTDHATIELLLEKVNEIIIELEERDNELTE